MKEGTARRPLGICRDTQIQSPCCCNRKENTLSSRRQRAHRMPRNDQVTRQWHLLRLLESPRGVTLDDIASRLPQTSRSCAAEDRPLPAWVRIGWPLPRRLLPPAQRPPLDAFVQDALTVMRGPRVEMELLFDKATAAWAKDPHLASWPGDEIAQRWSNAHVADGCRLMRIGWLDSQLRHRGVGRETGEPAGSGCGGSEKDRDV